jgi:hypothetical protein
MSRALELPPAHLSDVGGLIPRFASTSSRRNCARSCGFRADCRPTGSYPQTGFAEISSNVWSRSVTIKQGHELITTGPYAVVRHPIYTGILTGFLGMAIAISQVRGFIVFVLIFLAFWIKLRMEEPWMRSQFGEAYDTYAQSDRCPDPLPLLIAASRSQPQQERILCTISIRCPMFSAARSWENPKILLHAQ